MIEDNGAKHKLFWDEVESVKKPGKHGESAGAAKPAASTWARSTTPS